MYIHLSLLVGGLRRPYCESYCLTHQSFIFMMKEIWTILRRIKRISSVQTCARLPQNCFWPQWKRVIFKGSTPTHIDRGRIFNRKHVNNYIYRTESQTRGRCGAGGSSLFVFFLDYKYTYRVYGIWARGHFSHQMNNCYPQLKQRPLKALQPLCLNINNALTTNLPPGPRKHQMGA